MQDYQSFLPLAFGGSSLIINFIAYIIVRKMTYRRPRTSGSCCCAWTSALSSILLLGIGACDIWWSLSSEAGGTWIGFLVVLSGLYWSVQAMKYHKMVRTQSSGYQAFNNNAAEPSSPSPRRRSNAPLIVEVDSNNPSMGIEPNLSSSISPMSSAAKSRYSQPLIRNAVPPSPFISSGNQGTDSYVAIPMSITKTVPRCADSSTPQGTMPSHTLGDIQLNEEEDEEMNDTLTEQHAEDSIYIEEEEEPRDGDDGKAEEEETPRGGTERKTSEGNATLC